MDRGDRAQMGRPTDRRTARVDGPELLQDAAKTGAVEPVARRGDGAELLEHVAALRRYALLLVGSPEDADDLVQEALVRVLVRTRVWRPVRDLRAYLFTTLHHVFIDELRRKRHTPAKVDLEGIVDRLVVPAGQMDRLEWRDFVRALSRLPVEQREVVLLVGMEGLSYAEAARVLGVPIGTVMSRLSRGREALRRLVNRAAPRLRVVDRS